MNKNMMRQSDHSYLLAPSCVAKSRDVTAPTNVVVPSTSSSDSFSRRGRARSLAVLGKVQTAPNVRATNGSCRKKHHRQDRWSVRTPPSSGAIAAAAASAPPPSPAYIERFGSGKLCVISLLHSQWEAREQLSRRAYEKASATRPAAEKPIKALPMIKMAEVGASPHSRVPHANKDRLARCTRLWRKREYVLPNSG